VLEHISKSNFARLELVVYNAEREAKQSLPRKAADALRMSANGADCFPALCAMDRRKIAGTIIRSARRMQPYLRMRSGCGLRL